MMIKDEDKIRESIKTDIDTNMFVEAGAGAGKTTILVDRIINQFKSGKYAPEEIVAITFTKKAAEELKERMVKKVNDEIISNIGKGEVYENLLKVGKDLDKMQLSTIHSFCFKLLMERALDAKLRLDVCMLEESENDEDKKIFFSKWFKSKDRSYEEFKKLTELGIWRYYDLCFDAFNSMTNLPSDVIIEINKDLLKKNIDEFPIIYKTKADGTIEIDKYGKKEEDKSCKEYFNKIEYQSNFIINYVCPAVLEYRKEIKNHYISNDILLQKARELLRDENALNYFKKKYKTIYVDEFQDTDKVQVDMLKLLCGDGKGGLRDGSLFVVGDPKQSIYRFRGADVPLYLEVKEYFKKQKNAVVYELNWNFRSNKKILDFVNYNAKREFVGKYTDMDSKSKSNEMNDKNEFKGVYYLTRPNLDKIYEKGKIKNYKRNEDAEYLIAIINGLINSDKVIFDKTINNGEGGFRKIEYRDFLVLCKSIPHMDEYMDEMMKNNIPVQISSNVDVSCNMYLIKIKDIYGLITYSYDKKTKEAFAQSYYNDVFTKEKYDELDTIIKYIKNATKDMDAYSKLLYISHNLDLYMDCDKNVRKNMVRRITTQVEQMVEMTITNRLNNEQDIYDGLCDFIANGYEREIIEENDANAVRFMNLHKSKGLEGKIVIICKRTTYNQYDFSSVHIRDDEDITHYFLSITEQRGFDKKYYPSYYSKEEITTLAKKEEEDEFKRLAYVESTRPMEALIFLDLVWTKKDLFITYDFSFAKSILDPEEGVKEVEAELSKNIVEPMKAIKYKGNQFIVEKDDTQKKMIHEKKSPSSFEEEVDIDIDEKLIPKICGPIYGTVMHRTFELIINGYDKEIAINKSMIENVDNIKENAGEDFEDIKNRMKEVLNDDASKFLDSDIYKNLIKNAKNVYAEYPFKYKGEDGCIISGTADLVVENKDNSITIIDYKSNFNPGLSKEEFAKMLNKRYKGQLEMYKKAFGKIYDINEEKINVILYNKNIC